MAIARSHLVAGKYAKQATGTSKTNRRIAALSGLGIILVVIGHTQGATSTQAAVLAATDSTYRAWLSIISWIYTFHMPLFLAISGYLFGHVTINKKGYSYRNFIRDKLVRLLVPYALISSLAFLPKAQAAKFASRPLRASWFDYLQNLLIPWDNVIVFFWFLPTLFLYFLVAPLFARYAKSSLANASVLIGGVCLWFWFPHAPREGILAILNIGGALHNWVFFFSGYLARNHLSPGRAWPMIVGIVALSTSVSLYIFFGTVPAVALTLAFLGLLFCYAFVCTNASPRIVKWLAAIGDYSYQIYLLSWFPLTLVRVVFQEILAINIWVVIALSAVLGTLVPIIATMVLDETVPPELGYLYGGDLKQGRRKIAN